MFGLLVSSRPVAATVVSRQADISEVDNSFAGDPNQRHETAVGQQQNVVENTVGQGEVSGAVAVVPGHVSEMQQIERGIDVAAGKGRLDSSFAFFASLLAADSHLRLPLLKRAASAHQPNPSTSLRGNIDTRAVWPQPRRRSRRVALKLTDTDLHGKPAALEVTYTWR